jgi:hypothetical protein
MDSRVQLASLAGADDANHVLAAFDHYRVVVTAPPERCVTAADQAALFNAVNLLARVFAHVELRIDASPTWRGLLHPGGTLLARLRATIALIGTRPAFSATEELHLGWGHDAGHGVAADAAGWSYSYGTRHLALGSPNDAVAFGGLAASSLAVGQLFGRALAPLGVSWHEVDGIISNLLDYRHAPAPAGISAGRLGPAVLAGTGSVGSSVVYGALLVGVIGGPVDLVDPDTFSERNLLRYPAVFGVTDATKVATLTALAKGSGLDLRPHPTDVTGFLAEYAQPPTLPLVVSSVDTVEGRLDATDLLARTTLSAGVSGLQLHVAAHGFGGDDACAFCQYVDAEPALSGTALLAEAIGLSVERVIVIRHRGGRLQADDADAVAGAGRLSGPISAGDRLEDLHRRVYAQATVSAAAAPLQVSAPQVSALAGLLLLVEAIKHSDPALADYRLRGRYDVDTSGAPPDFVMPLQRDSSRRCICWSSFRQTAYGQLHASR